MLLQLSSIQKLNFRPKDIISEQYRIAQYWAWWVNHHIFSFHGQFVDSFQKSLVLLPLQTCRYNRAIIIIIIITTTTTTTSESWRDLRNESGQLGHHHCIWSELSLVLNG